MPASPPGHAQRSNSGGPVRHRIPRGHHRDGTVQGSPATRCRIIAVRPRILERPRAVPCLAAFVAPRVSGASGFSAPHITPLPVAYVCRTGAGIPPPSPIDKRRVPVHWEKRAQGEHETSTRGVAHGHLPRWPRPWPLPGSLGCGPCRRHVRPPRAAAPAARRVSGACAPVLPHSVRHGACGRGLGLVRCSTRRAMRPPP